MDVQPSPRPPAHIWRRRLAGWTRSGALPLVLAVTVLLGLWIFKDRDASGAAAYVPAAERALVEEPPRPTADDLAEAYPMIDRSALEVIAEIGDARARAELLEKARARIEAETRAASSLYPPGLAIGPAPIGGDKTSPFDEGRDALGGLPPIEEEPGCGSNCWDDAPATGDAE